MLKEEKQEVRYGECHVCRSTLDALGIRLWCYQNEPQWFEVLFRDVA